MPLPEETLKEIKENLDKAKERIADIEGTITDLRASGIDASHHEEELKRLKDDVRKWEAFYGLQQRRRER